jgi:integrase
VAAFTYDWFWRNRPTWKPSTRSSAIDAATRFLPLFVTARATDPPGTIAAEVRAWLRTPNALGEMPSWLRKWTVSLADIDSGLCRDVEYDLALDLQGAPLAANSANRYRTVAKSVLNAAADAGLLERNPWPARRSKRRVAEVKSSSLDLRSLPSRAQVEQMLNAVVNHQPQSRGYKVLFELMYFAGLRPSEARAARVEKMQLPKSGWGSLTVDTAAQEGPDADAGEEYGGTKTGVARVVPLPPVLVERLREYVGSRKSGLLVETRGGGPVTISNLDRAFARVRLDDRWSPYWLRHCCVTTWLEAGVPVGEAARRLGHSVEVLLSTYAGVLMGSEELANARIEAALS